MFDKLRKPIIIEFPDFVYASQFTFATANDMPERDPVQWKLEGSIDGNNWIELHVQNYDFQTTIARNTIQKWFYFKF
jgi:hypothetical protein